MRIAIAQLNPIVGDVHGNTALILQAVEQARRERADVLVTSELALIGYPPRDLLFREGVVEACEQAVRHIAAAAGELHIIIGHPRICAGGTRPLRNSASVCHGGKVVAVCDKQLLPGYDVFDEDRYFEPGGRSLVASIGERTVGIVICEDLWRANDVTAVRRYPIEPVAELATQHCDLIISLNASPFVLGKWQRHLAQLAEVAVDNRVPIVAVNQVGANDDLIFDGRSIVVSPDGEIVHVLPGFQPSVRTIDLGLGKAANRTAVAAARDQISNWSDPNCEVFHALVLGIRDYCSKTGNSRVLLGLSGGIDSALTAVLATAALGPERIIGVMMPSRYSSRGSVEDSLELARRIGIADPHEVSIESIHGSLQQLLKAPLGEVSGVTDENIQARLRGIILMGMSNSLGGLVLATSNKSEMACGYSTLYGDMCGGLAVLGDMTKSRIYSLSRWINASHAMCGFSKPPIPESSITKPPSAELRPNQTDQDSLPPYDILDQIIERYVELEQSESTIIAETGFESSLVRNTLRMIDRAQYKRDQAPVVLKLTGRAFGRGRPMPIVIRQTSLQENPPALVTEAPREVLRPEPPPASAPPHAPREPQQTRHAVVNPQR